MQHRKPWLICGANGFTGRLLAEEALAHGMRPTLAGRSAAAIEHLAAVQRVLAGLSDHPQIVRAMRSAIGAGTDSLWMSSVFLEDDSPQRKVERRLAAYLGAEDCVLMQSGYCANLGLLQSIAGPGTPVYPRRSSRARA
jgi:7-keto-8-aminopelargonate synthetase-like enzyme